MRVTHEVSNWIECVPTVPVAMLFRSFVGSQVQHRSERPHFSLPLPCDPPLKYIHPGEAALPSHALHATYLYFPSFAWPSSPFAPFPNCQHPFLGSEYILRPGVTRLHHHDCTEIQPMDEQIDRDQ
eukprot:scaffold525_cov307-Pavlova_lutheri.AAC.10